jgi:hypothetical protein
MMRTDTSRLVVLFVASFFLLISWGASAQDIPALTPTPAPQGEAIIEQPIDVTLLPPPHTAYF